MATLEQPTPGGPRRPGNVATRVAAPEPRRRVVTNTPLIDELHKELAPLESVYAIGQAVTRVIARTTGARRSSLFLWERDPGILRQIAGVDADKPERTLVTTPPAPPVWDEVLVNQRPLLIPDASVDDRFPSDMVARFRLKDFIAVPLISGTATIGLLTASRWPTGSKPSAAHVQTLEAMAEPAVTAITRARLVETERARAEGREALTRFAQRLSHQSSEQAVAEALASAALQATGAAFAVVVARPTSPVTASDPEVLPVAAAAGCTIRRARKRAVDGDFVDIIARAVKGRDVAVSPAVDLVSSVPAAFADDHGLIAAPMLGDGDDVLGAVVVGRRDPHDLDSLAAKLLHLLAIQAGMWISNTRLLAEERRQRSRAAALLHVAAALNQVGSLGELMPVIAAAAADAVGVSRAAVYAYDDLMTTTVARGFVGPPAEAAALGTVASLRPSDVPAEQEVIRTGLPLFRDRRTPFPIVGEVEDWQSDLVTPLLAAGSVQGVLYVWEPGQHRIFSPEDIALLQAIGHLAGLAILRARDAQAAERRAQHLGLLNQVGRALSSSLDLEALCAAIQAQVSQVLVADVFLVALYEAGDDEIWFPYIVERGRRLPEERRRHDGGPTSKVIEARQPLLLRRGVDSLYGSAHHIGDPERWTESAIFVPMFRDERLIGVLSVQRYDKAPYNADDLGTLETIAQQSAAALAHSHLYAQAIAARDGAERQAANLRAVLNVSRSIASAPDLESMLRALADELANLVPHDEIALFRVSTDRRYLEPVLNLLHGMVMEREAWQLRVGEGLVGDAFVTGQAELVNNAHLDPRSVYPIDGGRYLGTGEHVVQAPLVVEGEVIGVLHLNRLGATPFREDEFAVVQALAEQAAVAVRNAMLLDDAEAERARAAQHAANLEAVLATTRTIASETDLTTMLDALANELARLIPHDELGLYQPDAAGRSMVVTYRRSLTRGGSGIYEGSVLGVGEGIVGEAFVNGQAELANDAQLNPRSYYPDAAARERLGREHLMAVPLKVGGRIIGVLALTRIGQTEPFTEDDFAFFRVLAGQAGIAVHTSLLFEDERGQRRRATTLVDAASSLNRASTLDDVVSSLAMVAANAVGANRCVVVVFDEQQNGIAAAADWGGESAGRVNVGRHVRPSDCPIEAELMSTGSSISGVRLHDLHALTPPKVRVPMRGGVVVPVNIRQDVQGAIYLWSSVLVDGHGEPHGFGGDETALLHAIADQAGIAVERARLYAAAERRIGELRLLDEINQTIAGSFDLSTIVRNALQHLGQVVPFDDSVVTLAQEGGQGLWVIEAWGDHADELRNVVVPLTGSIAGRVYRTGKTVRGSVGDGKRYFEPLGASTLGRHILAVPLQMEGRTTGTIGVIRDEPGPFSEADAAIFRLLAGQLAVGVERARIFAVALAERQRSERQARNLENVLASSQDLAQQVDPESTLATLSEGISRLVPFTACAVFRAERQSRGLVRVHLRSSGGPEVAADRLGIGQGITGEAVLRLESVCLANVERDPRYVSDHLSPTVLAEVHERGLHIMAVPLLVEATLIGAITIYRVGGQPFSDEEFATVRVYAGQAAAAIRNSELLARNREVYLAGIRALTSAVDAKDPYTHGHSERVSRYAKQIAIALGCDEAEAETVELAGLLHDIGKIGVPDAVLQKPSRLDDAERAVMMRHVTLGAEILAEAGTDALLPLVSLVRHHHEWFNGAGYPDQLAGSNIPIGASIIAVADAFDTITTDRPYRPSQTVRAAVKELGLRAGTQFDPSVVDAFTALLSTDAGMTELHAPNGEQRPTPAGDFSPVSALLDREGGQLGDTRALGLLVELAAVTQHIPDLSQFLRRVCDIVRGRLDYQDVILMLVDEERQEFYVAAHSGGDPQVHFSYRQPIDAGVCGDVVRTGRPRNVVDVRSEPLFYSTWPEPIGSELVVPLIVEDRAIGVISVESDRVAAFTLADVAVLTAVAGQVAVAIHVAQLHDVAKRAAATDGLTGLANHRAFYEALDLAVTGAEIFSVVMLDVEGLKQVNDTAGHLAGDSLLRAIAEVIRISVRDDDLVARYGGDEFAVLMRGIGRREAGRIASRVRRRLLQDSPHGPLRTTVRFGVATFPTDGRRPIDLVAAADRRLYEMRKEGLRVTRL